MYGIVKGIVHRTEECHGTHSDDALRALCVLTFRCLPLVYYRPVRSIKCVIDPRWNDLRRCIAQREVKLPTGQTGKRPLRCE